MRIYVYSLIVFLSFCSLIKAESASERQYRAYQLQKKLQEEKSRALAGYFAMKKGITNRSNQKHSSQNDLVVYNDIILMVEEIGDGLYKSMDGALIIKTYGCPVPFYQKVMLRGNKMIFLDLGGSFCPVDKVFKVK